MLKSPISRPTIFQRSVHILLLLWLAFLLPALACDFSIVSQGDLEKTTVAEGVQKTLDADRATQSQATTQAQQTSLAAQMTELAKQASGQTLEAPTATAPSSNVTPTAEMVEPQATATPSPTPIPTPILITKWGMTYFQEISSGCKIPSAPCWKVNDSRSTPTDVPMILASKNSFFIDPSWKNPYLVYWIKFDLAKPASLEIQDEGVWKAVKGYSKGTLSFWRQDYVSLANFKGREIIIRFALTSGGHVPGRNPWVEARSEFYVTEIQIIPDFTPSSQ